MIVKRFKDIFNKSKNKSNDEYPNVGDYVLVKILPSNDKYIGIINSINETGDEPSTKHNITYTDEFIYTVYFGYTNGKYEDYENMKHSMGLYYFIDEIEHCSKDKKELEIIRNTEKFNI